MRNRIYETQGDEHAELLVDCAYEKANGRVVPIAPEEEDTDDDGDD